MQRGLYRSISNKVRADLCCLICSMCCDQHGKLPLVTSTSLVVYVIISIVVPLCYGIKVSMRDCMYFNEVDTVTPYVPTLLE